MTLAAGFYRFSLAVDCFSFHPERLGVFQLFVQL